MFEGEYNEWVRKAVLLSPRVVRALWRRHEHEQEHEHRAMLEDCVENAVIKFSEKLRTMWVPETLFGWILGAAERYYQNEFRKNRRLSPMGDSVRKIGTNDSDMQTFEARNEIEAIFARMQHGEYREVVRLVDYEDCSVKEVSEKMGKSVEAIYHLKERGEKEAREIAVKVLGISQPNNNRAKRDKNKF